MNQTPSTASAEPTTRDQRLPSSWRMIAFAALGYVLLGILGLTFAIPPGYASPIFPAAGFAVAALLWSNNRAWPGIWLGSLTINLGVAWLQGHLDWRGIVIAAGIAAGSTLQAMLARWLAQRGMGTAWRRMQTEREIIIILILAGPVACLVSASVGVSLLWWTRVVPSEEYLFAWWSWWSGDTLGVLVMLPLTLVFLLRPVQLWRNRLASLVLPMCVALAAVGSTFYFTAQWERGQQKQLIQAHGEMLANLLTQRFFAHQEALSALRRLTEVSAEMSFAQFEYFTRITLADNPDIFALSINPYVRQPQRSAFERAMERKTGVAGFEIKEKSPQKGVVRAAERDAYVVVGYIAPLQGNRSAQGYDINSEPIRRAAIRKAMATNLPAATAPIHLVQENRERVGMLVLHPFRQSLHHEPGKPELAGFAVGVIKIDEMVEIATRQAAIPGLILQVDDVPPDGERKRVYRSSVATTDSALNSDYAWTRRLQMADRVWEVRVIPTSGYLRQQPHLIALAVGIAGLLLASLLQVLLLATTGKTAMVEQKVLEQTADIQAKANALEDRNTQLNVLFELSPDGFLTFNAQRRIKYASPAFTRLTGIPAETVIGLDEAGLSTLLTRASAAQDRTPDITALRKAVKVGAGNTAEPSAHWQLIEFAGPSRRVLEIGIRLANTATVSQILYLRDVTRETEIDHMKSEFLSHAAHELRTPMASILGYSELLLAMDFTEEERREHLHTIHNQSKLIVKIINELLDLARIDARRGKDFVPEYIKLQDFVPAVAGSYKPPGNRSAPAVEAGDTALFVKVDRQKLTQALLNVISNAYKYSPAGGDITIELLQREETEHQPAHHGIRIRDHGIGMTPEQIARIFERFYRADNSGKIPGTGLGMSIVKEIIELHGGTIDIDSQPGKGTSVTLWIPAAPTLA